MEHAREDQDEDHAGAAADEGHEQAEVRHAHREDEREEHEEEAEEVAGDDDAAVVGAVEGEPRDPEVVLDDIEDGERGHGEEEQRQDDDGDAKHAAERPARQVERDDLVRRVREGHVDDDAAEELPEGHRAVAEVHDAVVLLRVHHRRLHLRQVRR